MKKLTFKLINRVKVDPINVDSEFNRVLEFLLEIKRSLDSLWRDPRRVTFHEVIPNLMEKTNLELEKLKVLIENLKKQTMKFIM